MTPNFPSRNGYSIFGGIGPINRRSFWVRGRATVEGDLITLDLENVEGYVPFEGVPLEQYLHEETLINGEVQERTKRKDGVAENVALALANLSLPIKPQDAVAFVENYGLLFRGQVPTDITENFREWEEYVFGFRNALETYRGVQQALKGDSEALKKLTELAESNYRNLCDKYDSENIANPNWPLNAEWKNHLLLARKNLYEKNLKEREKWIIAEAEKLIAFFINTGLECVILQITPEAVLADAGVLRPREDRAGKFAFDPRAECLIGFAFHQLAMLVVENRPLERCENPRCSRFYELKQNNQRYCSERCGGQVRQRELQARRKALPSCSE